MSVHRGSRPRAERWQRRLLFYIPPILTVIVAALLLLPGNDTEPALDDDLCPLAEEQVAEPSEQVALLLDLRKPLDPSARAVLDEALRTVAWSMSAGAELRVFALADNADMARRPIARLCKPYDNAELTLASVVDTAENTRKARDCDSLNAQLPASVYDNASRFCARRTALQQRIEQMVAQPAEQPVADAYLIEAMEETSLTFADASQPPRTRSLYILSDMAQHADWYSHWELGRDGWSFDEFERRRKQHVATAGPPPPPLHDVAVTVFYVPRQGVTDNPRVRQAHQRFWQNYLADAFGTTPAFLDQPAMPMYELEPLMSKMTDAELAAQQRLQVQQQLQEAERLLAQIEQERASLEEERRREEATPEAPPPPQPEAVAQPEIEAAAQPEAAAPVARQEETETALAAAQPEQSTADPVSPGQPADSTIQPAAEQSLLAAADEADSSVPAGSNTVPPGTAPPQRSETADVPAEAADNDSLPLAAAAETPTATANDNSDNSSQQPDNAAPDSTEAPVRPPAFDIDQAAPELALDPSSNDQSTEIRDADAPPCTVQLRPRYRNEGLIYPFITNQYASASITVRYVVDDRGETVDDDIVMVTEQSTATPPRFIDKFGQAAVDTVKRWKFDFQDTDSEACVKRQRLTARLEFSYK